ERKVPRYDLPDNADRLVPRIAVKWAFDRNCLAMDLVGPAGVVAVALDGERHVDVLRVLVRLAIVERFEGGQVVGVLFDQVGELVHEPATLGGAHLRPRAGIKRLAGGLDGEIDVSLVAFRDVADLFARAWVERRKRLAGN